MRRGGCIWARFRIMYQIWQAHSLITEQLMLIIVGELKCLRFIHLVKWSLTERRVSLLRLTISVLTLSLVVLL